MTRFISLFIFISISWYNTNAQYSLGVNIKGVVTDEILKNPISGVVIYNVDNSQSLGITNINGEFEITLDDGRKLLTFARLGYQTTSIEVDVRPITEYMHVSLKTNVIKLDSISTVGSKSAPNGGVRFEPEQAYRYAGSMGDPARMAKSFAGVRVANDNRNNLIIRGNSPTGLQWRIDGFEISNPNHHASMGLTGSTITLLNSNLLTTSDLYLGGWDANFSNSTSGIFDLKMRGQKEIKKESYWAQLGWNGVEVGTEGNFDKNNKTTYLINYRYSFFDILQKVGINLPITPEYQDFTFKTTSQIGDRNSLEFLGIWGDSHLTISGIKQFHGMPDEAETGSQTILAGMTHKIKFRDNQLLTSRLSYIRSYVHHDVINNNKPFWKEDSYENKYSFSSEYHLVFGTSNVFTAGLNFDLYDINYDVSTDKEYSGFMVTSDENDNGFRVTTDEDGNLAFIRGFIQYQKNISNKIKATVGINSSYLNLNGSRSIEPRFALKYSFNSTKSITLSAGCYSQMQPRQIYFSRDTNNIETNIDLGFTKNVQSVLSYNWAFNSKWNFKAEAYFQYLYDIPVVNDPNSTLSTINLGSYYYLPILNNLINNGYGYNYGIEMTVERYFQNNFYLLANGSLYSSKYSNGFNDKLYSTSFDGNYTFNLTGGYEWNINSHNSLLLDIKGSYVGGQRYTPLYEDATIAAGKEVFDYSKTNAVQLSPYMRIDLKATYRINAKKSIYDFSIDFQNLTNHKNPYIVDYTFTSTSVDQLIYYQQLFLPILTIKVVW